MKAGFGKRSETAVFSGLLGAEERQMSQGKGLSRVWGVVGKGEARQTQKRHREVK